MLYLVTYDLPSTLEGDRRRARLASFLERVGLRVQWSVFEMEIPPENLPRIRDEIEDRIREDEDSVRIYPLCNACVDKALYIGRKATCEHGPLIIW